MAELLTINEKREEIRRLMQHDNKTFEEALEIVKGYEDSYHTNPSIQYKNVIDIIPPGTDLDNGEVFDLKSGQTIRDL